MPDKIKVCVNQDDLALVLSLARRVLTEHLESDLDMDEVPEGLDNTLFDYRAAIGAVDKAMHSPEKVA